ncbi:MAG: Nramp family divalent metal transporter [Cyclobacteriaceae bacterium]
MKQLIKALLAFGPGIFAIGYTIGTGSVTSMIVAGSSFGMQLLWVLFLSCLFSGVLIFVYGQYTLVSGETALFAFKKYLPWGKVIAIMIIVGISFGQWNSLIGILGISSNVLFEILILSMPALADYQYETVLILAIAIIGIMYSVLLIGDYTLFEKVLAVLVSFMGLSFFFTLFFVFPLPEEILLGLIPKIPDVEGGSMLAAAFVGTTMASATFLSRPLFVKGKGWTMNDLLTQKNDAIVAASLVFIISGSIMAVASGSLFREGIIVNKVVDMSHALTPIAGKFAMSIFFFGTLSAGLSSVFPCLLIVPIMLSDYRSGELETKSRQFKWITGIASLVALTIPVFGFNPVEGQIMTQVFNVFVLPLVIVGIILLTNRKELGEFKTGLVLNVILVLALIFSIVISINGVIGIVNYLR